MLCAFITFVAGIVGAISPLAKGLKEEIFVNNISAGSSEWTGFQMIWGQAKSDSQDALPIVSGTLAAWILIVIAALCCMVFLFRRNGNVKYILTLGGICALVSGILFFCSKNLIGVSDSSGTLLGITGTTKYTLEIGLLLPAILGCIGGTTGLIGGFASK